jgi:hypothetical protein
MSREEAIYEDYVCFCERLKVKPASEDLWRLFSSAASGNTSRRVKEK